MSKFTGRQAAIGIGKESVRGTAVASTYFIPWRELSSIDDKVTTVKNDTALARLEASDGYAVTSKYADVSWNTKLKDSHFGLLLLSLFGTVSSVAKSSPNTSVYDHTFSVLQSVQHPSLTIAYKDSNVDLRFANAVVNTLKLNIERDNYVMYEVSTLSKPSASASNTVSYSQENDFLPQHLTFKTATTQSGLDAASAVNIRSANIEFSQNLMFEQVLGTTSPNDVLTQSFTVKGSVTLVHNATTYSALQNAGTYQALRFDLLHTATIGTSSNPELKIDLHRCSLTNYQKRVALNDIVEESFDFEGHYSLSDSKMATVVLTNLVTSY